jgi:hypothetical protein
VRWRELRTCWILFSEEEVTTIPDEAEAIYATKREKV